MLARSADGWDERGDECAGALVGHQQCGLEDGSAGNWTRVANCLGGPDLHGDRSCGAGSARVAVLQSGGRQNPLAENRGRRAI